MNALTTPQAGPNGDKYTIQGMITHKPGIRLQVALGAFGKRIARSRYQEQIGSKIGPGAMVDLFSSQYRFDDRLPGIRIAFGEQQLLNIIQQLLTGHARRYYSTWFSACQVRIDCLASQRGNIRLRL